MEILDRRRKQRNMPIKTLIHPESKLTIRFGRKRPIALHPSLSIENYLLRSMPSPPKTVDYSAAAMAALDQTYDNDTLGDCVIAAQAHLVGVFTGNAAGGSPVIFSLPQIVARYSSIGGYVPGEPSTDNGCDMQTALAYWKQYGMMPGKPPNLRHKNVGWMTVNPSDVEQMQTAIWLFGNLDIGLELPDAWVNPFPSESGFVWDVAGAPDPSNGHNVCAFGYSAEGLLISTWGMIGTMTWAAVARYVAASAGGELYTVLSHDWISTASWKAPSGFDFTQLSADLQAIQ
jgi:hypothetical protein